MRGGEWNRPCRDPPPTCPPSAALAPLAFESGDAYLTEAGFGFVIASFVLTTAMQVRPPLWRFPRTVCFFSAHRMQYSMFGGGGNLSPGFLRLISSSATLGTTLSGASPKICQFFCRPTKSNNQYLRYPLYHFCGSVRGFQWSPWRVVKEKGIAKKLTTSLKKFDIQPRKCPPPAAPNPPHA